MGNIVKEFEADVVLFNHMKLKQIWGRILSAMACTFKTQSQLRQTEKRAADQTASQALEHSRYKIAFQSGLSPFPQKGI